MDTNLMFYIGIAFFVSIVLTYLITNNVANKKIKDHKSLSEALESKTKKLKTANDELKISKENFEQVNAETQALQELKYNADSIKANLDSDTLLLEQARKELLSSSENLNKENTNLYALMSKIDLYSRINEFVDVGHYEMPAYLYETSARFAEEIKRSREQQKELIKNKEAITCDATISFGGNTSEGKKVLDGQVKLILAAFNIESDLLIAKVSPSNFPKILERIEKLANTLEKSAISLHCGFNIEYVELKMDECRLQYQFTLKKKEEQDEQRLIKEQIREEQRAIKEYEKSITDAEKEEKLYRSLLQKARKQFESVNDEEKIIAQQKIEALELQLAEAEAKGERAKSMAQQTRKGHVYVISNVGSFGDNIYKIGLTRRLEPMDRVKELGDASVPFSFDVHAMIYVEDAPALESALHREFTHKRVNAVNLRKEFFTIDLESIKEAVNKIAGVNAEFNMTVLAEEYYESKRLSEAS
ncbi:MAG: DNA repair exonuclease SbcCD ATPase subunit [Colwellia sp.]|jgi:DNA repair exonuclease SbcCD ATPase subunit